MASESAKPVQLEMYQRVVDLLSEGQQWDPKSLTLKAELQLILGDLAGAIETRLLSIDLEPRNLGYRFRLAHLYIQTGELEEALAVASYLRRQDNANENFKKLYERIRRLQNQKLNIR